MSAAEYRERIAHAAEQTRRFRRLSHLWRRRLGTLRQAYRRRREQPKVVGVNQVLGGSPRTRLLYAAEQAIRTFRPFYGETGSWDAGYALTNVPDNSYRSDCSWWFTALYRCCGLDDPNGAGYSGGFTGTLLAHGRVVSRRFAETHAGCAVLFGDGDAFHVGIGTGRGATIYQHGQAPIETGTFDQFGPGVLVRYRDYLS